MPRSKFAVRYSEDQAEAKSLRQIKQGQSPEEAAQVLRFLDNKTFSGRAAALLPTDWQPGRLEKIAVMRGRVSIRLSPFSRGDARLGEKARVNQRAKDGDAIRNGSAPIWCQREVDEHAHLDDEELTEDQREAKENAEFWAKMDEVARSWLAPDSEEFKAVLSPAALEALAEADRRRREGRDQERRKLLKPFDPNGREAA